LEKVKLEKELMGIRSTFDVTLAEATTKLESQWH
jgi:hypothetical protein